MIAPPMMMVQNRSMTAHLLIVDDDPHIRDVIRIAAETSGFRVSEAANGRDGLTSFDRGTFDLIVLDIGMPHLDGFEFCKALRSRSDVPVLFLTARDEEIDRVLGFELGADDFVAKPFSPRELILRIRAILSRGRSAPEKPLTHGVLTILPGAHQAQIGDADLTLTATEFSVLLTLARHPDQVFDRNRLIDGVYGGNAHLSGRTVDSHIRNIRAKAAKLGCADIIDTVHGVGLRLGACSL